MTKKEALAEFKRLHPKTLFIRNGWVDKPMRDQAWNDFTDGLHKEGRINNRQFQNWVHPWNDR